MLPRRSALLLPLIALGCAQEDPVIPVPSGPISFRHLLPLRLNVAEVAVSEANPPVGPGDFGAELPMPPAEAVRQVGRDRLFAVGNSGRATFSVTQATLIPDPSGVTCLLGCRVDIVSAEGARMGFIEASARASMTLPGSVSPYTRQRAGEAVLRQALDRLNVEIEFQAKRNLRAWLVQTAPGAVGIAAPAPGEVQREDLPRP